MKVADNLLDFRGLSMLGDDGGVRKDKRLPGRSPSADWAWFSIKLTRIVILVVPFVDLWSLHDRGLVGLNIAYIA